MTYRLTAERIGDTVLVQIDDGDKRITLSMPTGEGVQLGWDLLALSASDAPALTPELIVTGQGF